MPAMEAVEHPKTPEPKTETKIDPNEPVTQSPLATEDLKSTPAPATPARKPARVVPFSGTDTPKTDGSRPTTPGATIGTPPPVPRRAAARGTPRPGSMLVTPDIFKPPPPINERRATEKVGGEGSEKVEEKKENIAAERKETKVGAEVKGSTVVAEKTEVVIGVAPVAAEETKDEPKVDAEAPARAPSQDSRTTPEGEPIAAYTATPNTPVNYLSPLPEPTLEPPPPTTTATEITPADRASILSVSSASVYTKDTKDILPPIPATAAAEDLPDDSEWVSNARWEDRAWIEIVRIREKMFWARTGSETVGGTAANQPPGFGL